MVSGQGCDGNAWELLAFVAAYFVGEYLFICCEALIKETTVIVKEANSNHNSRNGISGLPTGPVIKIYRMTVLSGSTYNVFVET